MARQKREWHPNFIKYMEFIADHPNYKGMPDKLKRDGNIRWVVTKNSLIGKKREEWWKSKAKELGIPIKGKWKSVTARKNHPKELRGYKPCQICGRELSIFYIYPNYYTLKKLNSIEELSSEFDEFDEIGDIINTIIDELGHEGIGIIKKIFDIPDSVVEEDYTKFIIQNRKTQLSPGVMSDSPDRFDGFHTYNKCCRSIQDTGRHKENLARYIEDRRAYETWAEGDWKAASWLMTKGEVGECARCHRISTVTADHIGPISLGFAHIPIFQPLCKSCNSAKNYRMSIEDIKKLVGYEREGIKIISWHSKYIWDLLKNEAKDDEDAKIVSKYMRLNLHHIMEIFYIISANGFKDFLINFLNPQYAYYSIEFKNRDKKRFSYDDIVKKKGNKDQYKNNAARYIRIAFESLEKYHKKTKTNRRLKLVFDAEVEKNLRELLKVLGEGREQTNKEARDVLNEAFHQEGSTECEEKIKTALSLIEERPTINKKAEEILNYILKYVANIIHSKFKSECGS